jgi:hypothetical protein
VTNSYACPRVTSRDSFKVCGNSGKGKVVPVLNQAPHHEDASLA